MTMKDQETQLSSCFFVEFVYVLFSAICVSLDVDDIVMKEHPHDKLLIHFYANWRLYLFAQRETRLVLAVEALSLLKLFLDGDFNFIVTLQKR
jgi:hypothetical protein